MTARNISLAAILVVAAAARLCGINFGLPHLNCRPDEGAVVSIAAGLYDGDLNPHVFNYPAFFMLSIAIVLMMLKTSGLVAAIASTTAYRVARYLSAAAGIASVLMIFRIGLRLFGQTAALAGAALLSLAFLHVRDSHFGVTDVPMTFLVLVAFLFVVRLSESGETRDLIAAGVAAGLATSTKYNAALIALPAMLVIFTGHGCSHHVARALSARRSLRIDDDGGVSAHVPVHAAGLPAIHQGLHVRDQAPGGRSREGPRARMESPPRLHAALWRRRSHSRVRRRRLRAAALEGSTQRIAGCAVPGDLLSAAGQRTHGVRALHAPVVPFLCLAAGYAITEAALWLAARVGRPRLAPIMVAAGVIGVVWPSAQSVITFDRLISLDDNRLVARRWVERHFPKDTTLAQIGTRSGHVFLHDLNEPKYLSMSMRNRRNRPDLIIVQSSPLVPAPRELLRIESMLATEYELGFNRNGVGNDPANVYDWQDEFFLPMAGFRGIERPGPNFKIYIRRDAFPKVPRLSDGSASVR